METAPETERGRLRRPLCSPQPEPPRGEAQNRCVGLLRLLRLLRLLGVLGDALAEGVALVRAGAVLVVERLDRILGRTALLTALLRSVLLGRALLLRVLAGRLPRDARHTLAVVLEHRLEGVRAGLRLEGLAVLRSVLEVGRRRVLSGRRGRGDESGDQYAARDELLHVSVLPVVVHPQVGTPRPQGGWKVGEALFRRASAPATVTVERVNLLERRPVDPAHRVRDQARLEDDPLACCVRAPGARVGGLGGLELRARRVERLPQRRRAGVEVALAAEAVREPALDVAAQQRAQVLVDVRVPAAAE